MEVGYHIGEGVMGGALDDQQDSSSPLATIGPLLPAEGKTGSGELTGSQHSEKQSEEQKPMVTNSTTSVLYLPMGLSELHSRRQWKSKETGRDGYRGRMSLGT